MNRIKYVSIVDDNQVTVAFTDGTSETFPSDSIRQGLTGEEFVYPNVDENDPNLMQCGSCERLFTQLTINDECPYCHSGNWVRGYIDEDEPRRDDND